MTENNTDNQIEALERALGVHKRLSILLMLLVILLLGSGFHLLIYHRRLITPEGYLTARGIEVRNEFGNRVVLLHANDAGFPVLFVYDTAGIRRLEFGIENDGDLGFAAADTAGDWRLLFTINPDLTGFSVLGPETETGQTSVDLLARDQGMGGLALQDESGLLRIRVGGSPLSSDKSFISLVNPDGTEYVIQDERIRIIPASPDDGELDTPVRD